MLDICTIHDYPIKYYREFQTISIEGSIFLINSQSPPQNFFHFYGPEKLFTGLISYQQYYSTVNKFQTQSGFHKMKTMGFTAMCLNSLKDIFTLVLPITLFKSTNILPSIFSTYYYVTFFQQSF